MRLTLATPEGYGMQPGVLETVRGLCAQSGSTVEEYHDLSTLAGGFDVVYAMRWQTMGVPKSDPHWKEKFMPYRVTPELMRRFSKNGHTVFMHDLPAVRGDDVVDEVLDGPGSVAFRQAKHKMTSAMAVLEWCVAE
jgi:ornithine carbamoyltransferase